MLILGHCCRGEGEWPRAYVVLKAHAKGKLEASAIQHWLDERVVKYKRLRGGVAFVDEVSKSASDQDPAETDQRMGRASSGGTGKTVKALIVLQISKPAAIIVSEEIQVSSMERKVDICQNPVTTPYTTSHAGRRCRIRSLMVILN